MLGAGRGGSIHGDWLHDGNEELVVCPTDHLLLGIEIDINGLLPVYMAANTIFSLVSSYGNGSQFIPTYSSYGHFVTKVQDNAAY
ncbi:hypothetical protein GDO78_008770 [Eleutherodactylus coqui]|uniref:Uncharacterized protein n=1 Tax=Eleutherodactylus coqui TaxID=57060 RepID=A0A8J6FFL3_ELECQ|nr:hypothetical protein GDO78_008770 [Eleutherodactylus coqui]